MVSVYTFCLTRKRIHYLSIYIYVARDKCRQERPSLMRSFGLWKLTSAHVDRGCISPVRGWKGFAKGYV
jgi:hypothetical protein